MAASVAERESIRLELQLSTIPQHLGKGALGEEGQLLRVSGVSEEAVQDLKHLFRAAAPAYIKRQGGLLVVSDEPTPESQPVEMTSLTVAGEAGNRTITFSVIEAE